MPPPGTTTPPDQTYGGLPFPSREFVGKGEGWTQDLAFGAGNSRAAFIIDIPWGDLEIAIRFLMGWSLPSGGGGVSRVLPMQHPNFLFLWARGVPKVQGIQYQGTNTPGNNGYPVGDYSMARLTVEFWQPTYAIWPDGAVNEWERYTTVRVEPSAEFLARQIGNFKFDPAVNAPGVQQIVGKKTQQLYKKRIKVTWHQVPWLGLFPNAGDGGLDYSSPNIDGIINHVNNAAFAGCAEQTLLCEAPQFEPVPWPANTLSLGYLGSNVSQLYDVHFNLLFFDPPNGGTQRGHNTAPAIDGFWYGFIATDGANVPYAPATFSDLFVLN